MFEKQALTPGSELDARIDSLRGKLEESGLDAAIIIQNTDLFYFSGTIQQSHLYVPVDGDPLLLVKKSLERARGESHIGRIMPMESTGSLPALLKDNGYRIPGRIGMELDVLPANNFLHYTKLFRDAEIRDISPDIRMIRSVKSEYEAGLIEKSARLSDALAERVSGCIGEGMTEIEVAGLVEAEARKLGHQGLIRMRLWGNELFYGHLMSGPSAAVPSYLSSPTGGLSVTPAVAQGPGHRRIQRNEPLLVDYAFASDGYISDHTRIYSIGELPEDLVKGHEAMLEIQELIKREGKPGVRAGDLYSMAVEHAVSAGYGDHFMGTGRERVNFIGHGTGLELDEFPFIAENREIRLEKNMVIALEPKLIFPGRGVVGIENTHIVTETGFRQLTNFREEIIVL